MTATLTIGDFAKATQLSVKTLRHYHEEGLLVPAQVDTGSGYRRYTTDQIPVAQVIRRFRALGMPLGQIGAVLNALDPAARSAVVADHLASLEQELTRTQAAVGELRATLAAQRIEPAGPGGAVVSDAFFAEERGEITVFVPSTRSVRAVGRVVTRALPAIDLAVVIHNGSHDTIDRSYGALAEHVAERTIAVAGPIRERYLVGSYDTTDESRWRTEVGWPIFRTDSD